MNPNALRGLAALCLLCVVVPRASAVTITQSLTKTGSGGGYGSGPAGTSFGWNFNGWNASDGPLTSVLIQIDLTATVSTSDVNPWPDAIGERDDAFLRTSTLFASGIPTVPDMDSVRNGDAYQLPAFQTRSFSTDFAQGLVLSITDPAALAAFVQPTFNVRTLHMAGGHNRYGTGFLGVTATISVNYNVAETGSTLALWALPALAMVIHRRRRARVTGY